MKRFAVPEDYLREPANSNSFASWLRRLPVKPGRPRVYLYNGRPRERQNLHAAVLDIDAGSRDLQQCADAVIRLRAEYLFSRERFDDIHFNFTSGDTAFYTDWRDGLRPEVSGGRVSWRKSAGPDSSYAGFREYLEAVFNYAGSYSLHRELVPVDHPSDMKIGDVFIQGGFPGHAVIVVDMAWNRATGEKIFLLAQSYMPAQDIHILRNIENLELSPWYSVDFGEVLKTPEWDFKRTDLMRFRND
ncbi:MAG: DUF4846 domain-containing protein [Candidatus Krumholzibacteriales bacterium]